MCKFKRQSQLIVPPQPIVAAVGSDIILPCHLKPAMDVTAETLEWTRFDLNLRFVLVWRDAQTEHPSYKGRTSLFTDELKRGNISLKLSKVQLSDQGTYTCNILDKQSSVELVVGAVSSPVISLAGTDRDRGGVMLDCESAGWYPEPEVLWLDAEGKLLSAGPPETVRGPDDLYTVSSRVTVEKRHSNSFTCRVQQKNTNLSRDAHIHVPEGFFPVQSSSSPLFIVLAVTVAELTEGQQKLTEGQQKLTEGLQELREGQQKLTEGQQKLTEGQQKLTEGLQELTKRLQVETRLQEMTEGLQEKTEGLKQLRDQVKERVEEVEGELAENKKELEAVETEITEREKKFDKPQELLTRKENLFKAQWKLKETKKNYEKLKMKIEQLHCTWKHRSFLITLLGLSQEVGRPRPVMAMVGEDVVLPCQLDPPVDAVSMTIEWARPDLDPRFVHVWHDGQELLDDQNEAYKGRASLLADALKHGDISLKLSKVRTSDDGRYRCYIPTLSQEHFVQLLVGAVSSPVISLAGTDRDRGGVMLDCESAGWYPEPEVLWLDAEGKLLSAGPPETVRGPDDLYTVSSRVTVEKRHSNSFTCRVQQKNTNLSRDAHIHLPANSVGLLV
ncbi:butyrophilin-like protein 2 [Cottoperca gobio]|uniref:Butyrophilin-like protein 2 n=1 Tax=Cottoperca gobio TaxID=56716 RepID=A0A6J2RPR8_COTGO|nr:butyrophilin-like protein 2 [Cottoperca gobio]